MVGRRHPGVLVVGRKPDRFGRRRAIRGPIGRRRTNTVNDGITSAIDGRVDAIARADDRYPEPVPVPADRAAPPPDELAAPVPTAAGGDVEALRAKRLLVPVAGIEAKSLRSTFEDSRGGGRRHDHGYPYREGPLFAPRWMDESSSCSRAQRVG